MLYQVNVVDKALHERPKLQPIYEAHLTALYFSLHDSIMILVLILILFTERKPSFRRHMGTLLRAKHLQLPIQQLRPH